MVDPQESTRNHKKIALLQIGHNRTKTDIKKGFLWETISTLMAYLGLKLINLRNCAPFLMSALSPTTIHQKPPVVRASPDTTRAKTGQIGPHSPLSLAGGYRGLKGTEEDKIGETFTGQNRPQTAIKFPLIMQRTFKTNYNAQY